MFTLFGQDEVRQICNEILQKSPDSIAANIAMFSVAKLNGEYNSALSYIDKCLKVTPLDSPKRNDYAIEKARVLQAAYTKTSDNEYLNRSIAEYKSLLSKMPTNTSVLNNLAYMLAENEQNLEEALTYAEKVYEIAPNRADFLDTYAYVLYKNEKYEEAAQHVQASRQLFEQNNIPVPWDVFEHLGMIKEKLEERAEAADAYRQALKIGGDNLPDSTKQRLNSAIERLTQY
jgi:tetratricopeptide (TPR) repeat protein